MIKYKPGTLKVYQMFGKEMVLTSYDSEEWSYEWIRYQGVTPIILKLSHTNDPDNITDSFDFVDFPVPVRLEFEYES